MSLSDINSYPVTENKVWVKIETLAWFEANAFVDNHGNYWEDERYRDTANYSYGDGTPSDVYCFTLREIVSSRKVFEMSRDTYEDISWGVFEIDINDYPECLI